MGNINRAFGRSSSSSPLGLSPYAIGVEQRRLSALHDETQQVLIEEHHAAKKDHQREAQANRDGLLATDRLHLLGELLATLPAMTMADVGVLVCHGLEVADDITNNHLEPGELDERVVSLRRILASILPIVRQASERPLEAAVEPWVLEAPVREFARVEAANR